MNLITEDVKDEDNNRESFLMESKNFVLNTCRANHEALNTALYGQN